MLSHQRQVTLTTAKSICCLQIQATATKKETPCFIIQVTVRNDYTAQNPPDNRTNVNTGSAFFILSAKVYDKNNTQIEAHEYIPPNAIPSYNQQCLGSGETQTYDVYISATQQRQDIDHYELIFNYLDQFQRPKTKNHEGKRKNHKQYTSALAAWAAI